jgi:hypothetical protein
VDSLPSIHRNGQRRHPPIRKERHKGGYFVSLFEIRCSRKVLGRANGRENRNPEDRGAKQLLLVVAGRGEVRSRNGRSQESGGISGDGRDGTRGMDEGGKHDLCNKWPEQETEEICCEAFGGDRPSDTKGGGAGGLGGEGAIRSGMAMRKWGAKTLEMVDDGRREGSDSPRRGRASMYAVCVRGERVCMCMCNCVCIRGFSVRGRKNGTLLLTVSVS